MTRFRSQKGEHGRYVNGDTLQQTVARLKQLEGLYGDIFRRNRKIAALQEENANDETTVANIIWGLRVRYDQEAAAAHQEMLNQEEINQ